MSPGAAAGALVIEVHNEVERVKQEASARTPRAAIALRNAAIRTLVGPSPSAPGSVPGVRSGKLKQTWDMFSGAEMFGIESGMHYSGYLEHGTRKMAARPFKDKIQEAAMPEVTAIFEEIGG